MKRRSRSLPGILLHTEAEKSSIADSRSTKRRQIDELELENLRAKTKIEHGLQERHLNLDEEREEMEPRRRKEQQEQELRLKLQQQKDELRLRDHERALENERKKAKTDEERSRLEVEMTKGSSRATALQADYFKSVRSRRKLEITDGWEDSVAQQSGPSRPLPHNVIDHPKSFTQDRGDKRFGAHPKTSPLSQLNTEISSTKLQDSKI